MSSQLDRLANGLEPVLPARAAVGLAVKDPQAAQMAVILPMFILFFASSALVPVSTMPGWLQPVTRN